jgi:ABC-type polysaccharide/polyol phosphate export permease
VRASLFGTPMPMTAVATSILWTVVLFVTGVYYFRRMERLFADVL